MRIRGVGNSSSAKYVSGSLALLLFACAALCDDPPKAPTKVPLKVPAKPAPAAKPPGAAPSASKSSGPTTTSPGTTTTTSHPTAATIHPPSRNGGSLTKRPDGQAATLHDPKRGMDVHHSLSGNRRVVVERADHSRIVAERGGRGYVQEPYMYHGHEYARRSYYYRGHYYHAYYGRYYYHGVWVNPYFASFYYGPGFYSWVYNPWVAPVPYAWSWGLDPWYGYYGVFFTPYPVYAGASLWLTDYIIANSLAAAYEAQGYAAAAALTNPAPLTPEVKQLIADEVRQQVALENAEAKTAQTGEPDAASSSIQRALTDGNPHVFVAGHDLDVVDAGGTECALSEGDALQLTGQTPPEAQAATLAVLASKGGKECPKGDTVSVALQDLQEMQNDMRESIDTGLQELQEKPGQGGLPAAPASAVAAPVESPMAAVAPPPRQASEVAAEINQQRLEADKAEAGAAGGTAPPVVTGRSKEQVIAARGDPLIIVHLSAATIYVYQDAKITFKSGIVVDVQ